MSLRPAALQILEKCEHLVPTGGEELPDVVSPHVVSEVPPSLLCSLVFDLENETWEIQKLKSNFSSPP